MPNKAYKFRLYPTPAQKILAEGHISEKFLQGHEQGKVVQPPEIIPAEGLKVGILTDPAALIGPAQKLEPVFVELVIVYL